MNLIEKIFNADIRIPTPTENSFIENGKVAGSKVEQKRITQYF